MVDEIFDLAAQKLVAYTAEARYTQQLKESAKAIAELFDNNDCVLFMNERDLGMAEELKGFFGGNVQVQADSSIKIGGVRGYCESKSIIADETLDSKLDAQREWFIESAALCVL